MGIHKDDIRRGVSDKIWMSVANPWGLASHGTKSERRYYESLNGFAHIKCHSTWYRVRHISTTEVQKEGEWYHVSILPDGAEEGYHHVKFLDGEFEAETERVAIDSIREGERHLVEYDHNRDEADEPLLANCTELKDIVTQPNSQIHTYRLVYLNDANFEYSQFEDTHDVNGQGFDKMSVRDFMDTFYSTTMAETAEVVLPSDPEERRRDIEDRIRTYNEWHENWRETRRRRIQSAKQLTKRLNEVIALHGDPNFVPADNLFDLLEEELLENTPPSDDDSAQRRRVRDRLLEHERNGGDALLNQNGLA